MKSLTLVLLTALLCASTFAAEFPNDAAKTSMPDVRRKATMAEEKSFRAFQEYCMTPGVGYSTRKLIDAYLGRAPDPMFTTFTLRWMATNPKLMQSWIDGFTKLAVDAAKAGDTRATIYQRAADKLAMQAKESGVRQDAQAAVADALKALDQKK